MWDINSICKHEHITIDLRDWYTSEPVECKDCGYLFSLDEMKSMNFKSVTINEIIYKRKERQ